MSQDKVLFVDDEPGVLSAIRRAVSDEPYLAYFAGSGAEALAQMEKTDFSVIVTDMRMPVMDGLTLLKKVKEKYPHTVRIVLSGYTQLSQMLVTINQGEIFRFITKPWTNENELLPVIQQALEYHQLQADRDTLSQSLAAKNTAYQKIFQAMENKNKQEQKELQHLYKISVMCFALWRKSLAAHTTITPEEKTLEENMIRIAEIIYLTYLSQLPATMETASIPGLIDKIKNGCNDCIEFDLSALNLKSIQGNHKYCIMIFKILLHVLPNPPQRLTCKVTDPLATESLSAKLYFALDLHTYSLNPLEQQTLKTTCTLLNKTAAFYDMSVTLIEQEKIADHLLISWALETKPTATGKE